MKQTKEYFALYHRKNRERRLKMGSVRYYRLMSDPETARLYKEKKNAYQRFRYFVDLNWRTSIRLKKQLHRILQGRPTRISCIELTGCSIDILRRHLESRFKPGMTWDNYGTKLGWVVDHIKPRSKFDLNNPFQRCECFHFSNLQPLWYSENQRKSFCNDPTS